MKTTIKILLFILALSNLSYAVDKNFPLEGEEWKDRESLDVDFIYYEEAFLQAYEITKSEIDDARTANAFGLLRRHFSANAFDKRYEGSVEAKIKSKELHQLLKELFAKAKDPKTVRDYYFQGMFAYGCNDFFCSTFTERYKPFEYIIENYPDTFYAEYSYLLLAQNYTNDNNKEKAVEVYEKYIELYGNKNKRLSSVYYKLATMYKNLFYRPHLAEGHLAVVDDGKGKIALMLKYSDKLMTEFPEKGERISQVLVNLAAYNKYHKNDKEKALELNLEVFNNPKYRSAALYGVIPDILRVYKDKGEYEKAFEILEDVKVRFYDNRYLRKTYKEYKRYIEEIKLFGYDERKRWGPVWSLQEEQRKIYEANKDEILAFREEWDKKFEEEWPEPPLKEWEKKFKEAQEKKKSPEEPKIKRVKTNRVDLYLDALEVPTSYYDLEHHHKKDKKDVYFYEDEQPIKFNVTIINTSDGKKKIGPSDWQHNIRVYSKSKKYNYYFNTDNNKIKLPDYSSEHEFTVGAEKKSDYKVLFGKPLAGGKLRPGEERSTIIEVMSAENKPFSADSFYIFSVRLDLIKRPSRKSSLIKFGELRSAECCDEYLIIKPTTPDQIKDWTIRKGDKEVKEKKYNDATKHYQEVLEKEKEKQDIRKILLQKLATTYELLKDYINVKKYLTELLRHVEGEIKAAKDKSKLEEEKAKIEQKIKEIEGL